MRSRWYCNVIISQICITFKIQFIIHTFFIQMWSHARFHWCMMIILNFGYELACKILHLLQSQITITVCRKWGQMNIRIRKKHKREHRKLICGSDIRMFSDFLNFINWNLQYSAIRRLPSQHGIPARLLTCWPLWTLNDALLCPFAKIRPYGIAISSKQTDTNRTIYRIIIVERTVEQSKCCKNIDRVIAIR